MSATRTPSDSLAERLGRWSASQLEQSRPAPFPEDPGRGRTVLRRLVALLVSVAVIVAVLSIVAGGIGDAIWFASVGFGSVWTTETEYGAGLLAGGALVTAIVLAGNLFLAWRIARERPGAFPGDPERARGGTARGETVRGETARDSDARGGAAPGAPGSEGTGTRAADDELSSGEIMAGRSAIEPSGSRVTDARGRPMQRGLAGRAMRGAFFVVGLPAIGLIVVAWHVARFVAGSRLNRAVSVAGPRTGPQSAPPSEDPGLRAVSSRVLGSVFVAIGLLLAVVIGLQLQASWQTVALWLHAVPWSPSGPAPTDPVFGLDLGWWMFSLPFLHLAANVASLLLGLTPPPDGCGLRRGGAARRRSRRPARPVLHLAILGRGAAARDRRNLQWLGRYDLAYARTGS